MPLAHAFPHHYFKSAFSGYSCRFFMDHFLLHPYGFGSYLNSLIHDSRHFLRATKNIHYIYWFWDEKKVGIASLPQDFFDRRVHRDNAIAMLLKIVSYHITRAFRIGG